MDKRHIYRHMCIKNIKNIKADMKNKNLNCLGEIIYLSECMFKSKREKKCALDLCARWRDRNREKKRDRETE